MPNSNSLQRFSVKGAQINPRPCVAMKLIISGVAFSAAAKKSPSFSLFSSSTTIITFPFFTSSIAAAIVFNWVFFLFDKEVIFLGIFFWSKF